MENHCKSCVSSGSTVNGRDGKNIPESLICIPYCTRIQYHPNF